MKHYLIILIALVAAAVIGCVQDYEAVSETAVTIPPTEASILQPTETVKVTQTSTSEPTTVPATPTVTLETATATATPHVSTAVASDDGKVTLDGKELLDIATEAPGCFTDIPAEIAYAPTNEYFLVIPACIEGDNQLFLFQADGTGKQQITGPWDYLNMLNFTWADDGLSFTYERLNSCCVSPENIPADAPPVGLVQVDVVTGEKVLIATPTPRP